MTALRIAVIGAGHMGVRHAERVADSSVAGVELAGVADVAYDRAERAVGTRAARAARDSRELIAHADAAIVAVPSEAHFQVVEAWLRAGKDVLVEKPIAATVEQGERLLALAKEKHCILQVGHIEWFNAAMQVIREQIDSPLFAEVHRMGPFPERPADLDVVRDVMIHDLEILQRLLGEEPASIDAVGVPVLSTDLDIANARLHFPSGCVANLTASRVSAKPMRKLRFFQSDGYFSVDFLEQRATVFRRRVPATGGTPEIEVEQLTTDPVDSLTHQLLSFVACVRERTAPQVDAAGGVAALRTALRVRDAMPDLEKVEGLVSVAQVTDGEGST